MATVQKFRIPKSPSVLDIERTLSDIMNTSLDTAIEVSLARNTSVPILTDVSVAMLLATAATRHGRLSVKDAHVEWDQNADERFLRQIDGLEAIVLHMQGQCDLVNAADIHVPEHLPQLLRGSLSEGGLIEADHAGPTRTYVALDPQYAVPLALNTTSSDALFRFRATVSTIMQQLGGYAPNPARKQSEDALFEAVFEIFQNTLEHGRFRDGVQVPGLRYARFRKHIFNANDDFRARTASFTPMARYIEKQLNVKGSTRFLEISIGDQGEGIVEHYRQSKGLESADEGVLLEQLLTKNLSSKQLSGSGWGLPNTLDALRRLHAFVTLRTGARWVYSDLSGESQNKDELAISPVTTQALARAAGTRFTFMVPLPT